MSLILLTAMTLLTLSATRSAMLEQKAAGNMRDTRLAFEAAEDCLRAAETWLAQQHSKTGTDNEKFVYAAGQLGGSFWLDRQWWNNPQNTADASLSHTQQLMASGAQPRFVIEYLTYLPDETAEDISTHLIHIYRITCSAHGISENSHSVLQATTAKRFSDKTATIRRIAWRQLL